MKTDVRRAARKSLKNEYFQEISLDFLLKWCILWLYKTELNFLSGGRCLVLSYFFCSVCGTKDKTSPALTTTLFFQHHYHYQYVIFFCLNDLQMHWSNLKLQMVLLPGWIKYVKYCWPISKSHQTFILYMRSRWNSNLFYRLSAIKRCSFRIVFIFISTFQLLFVRI